MADINTILQELDSGNAASGTFFCSYDVFRKIYDMEFRLQKRTGISNYVVLMTVSVENADLLGEAMEKVRTCIVSSLRESDMATECSDNQFLILLQVCDDENAVRAIDRIVDKYNAQEDSIKADITYELHEQ